VNFLNNENRVLDVDCEHVDKHVFTVDSLNYGNEARWINHSCDPNLKTFGILIDRYKNYETLAFFAIKDIKVGKYNSRFN
jgi:euchromatic histone-lysine N-methyltransferase